MISSKSCFSVLAGREWHVGASRAKLVPPHLAPALPCPCLWLCLLSLSGMVERKGCLAMGGFAGCRGTLGCHTTSAIPVLRPHLCILLLHSSLSPWVWLQLGCSSGREAIPEMAAWQHQELLPAGPAGLGGGSARAAPGDRHCTPGLEGHPVCCVVAVSPCLGNK